MKIDGAKAFIIKRRILDCFLDCDECANYGCNVYKILAMLEELRWWRGQDLIPRQPLIAFIDNSNIKHGERLIKAISDVRRFPKAEPPHATVDERNGDCETCNNLLTDKCVECGEGRYYEPYIPKE